MASIGLSVAAAFRHDSRAVVESFPNRSGHPFWALERLSNENAPCISRRLGYRETDVKDCQNKTALIIIINTRFAINVAGIIDDIPMRKISAVGKSASAWTRIEQT